MSYSRSSALTRTMYAKHIMQCKLTLSLKLFSPSGIYIHKQATYVQYTVVLYTLSVHHSERTRRYVCFRTVLARRLGTTYHHKTASQRQTITLLTSHESDDCIQPRTLHTSTVSAFHHTLQCIVKHSTNSNTTEMNTGSFISATQMLINTRSIESECSDMLTRIYSKQETKDYMVGLQRGGDWAVNC